MRTMPLDIGMLHFVGIGGIGMSGIAETLHALGYRVQGSDVAANANVERLRGLGIEVMIGHDAANIDSASVIVVSTAIRKDNPEVVAARARLLPVVRRAEMLAELMRLKWAIAIGGTHGKTTTTSLVAAMLDAAGYDPTVINGGIINAYGRRRSPSSPTSIPSISISMAISTRCAPPSRLSCRTSRSTASPRCASTTRKSRR